MQKECYKVIGQIRARYPKFFFISDAQLIDLMASQMDYEKMMQKLLAVFQGIKAFKLSTSPTTKELLLTGVVKHSFEEISLADPLEAAQGFSVKHFKALEDEIGASLRHQFQQGLALIGRNFYLLDSIWQKVALKATSFQTVVLAYDVVFYHHLALVLAIFDENREGKVQQGQRDSAEIFKDFEGLLLTAFEKFLGYVRDTRYVFQFPRSAYSLMSQLIFQAKHHLEIATQLPHSLHSYEFLALPKFSLRVRRPFDDGGRGPQQVGLDDLHKGNPLRESVSSAYGYLKEHKYAELLEKYGKDPLLENSLFFRDFQLINHPDYSAALIDFEVVLQAMNYKLSYGFEIVDSLYDFVYTPLAQKITFSFLAALSTNSFVLAYGPPITGKTFTVQSFAKLMGKELFTLDLGLMGSCADVARALAGAAAGGHWVFLDNMEELGLRLLAVLAQEVWLVRQGVQKRRSQGESDISFGGQGLSMVKEVGLFASLTQSLLPGKGNLVREVPKTLLECFRVTNLAFPDYSYIVALRLQVFGFPQPEALAKELVLFT